MVRWLIWPVLLDHRLFDTNEWGLMKGRAAPGHDASALQVNFLNRAVRNFIYSQVNWGTRCQWGQFAQKAHKIKKKVTCLYNVTVQIRPYGNLRSPWEISGSQFVIGVIGTLICPEEYLVETGTLISLTAIQDCPVFDSFRCSGWVFIILTRSSALNQFWAIPAEV